MKHTIANYIKNISGWRTDRKLVIFSVDDYGNIRLDSKKALENLQESQIPFHSHFDRLDTLETREDLEALFEVLVSVKDKNGNAAVFTPYSLSCNIDFEALYANNYSEYVYELLPRTYEKLTLKDPKSYSGTWRLWQEGMENGLMKPQFHGREHFNLAIFNDLLKKEDKNLQAVLKQRSYVTIPGHSFYNNSWTAAYSFNQFSDTENYLDNLIEGLKAFKEVYGNSARVFTPPAQQFPHHLESGLRNLGLEYIDRPRSLKRHLGDGKYQMEKHKLGGGEVLTELVRNVVFEPTTTRISDWVSFSFKQIEAAFFMRKPANISSHRVNYCGHIDPKNREIGLRALKELLQKITKHWPEVEFISADQLGDLIRKNE